MTDPTELYERLVTAFQGCRWHEAQKLAHQLLPLAPRHAGVYGMAGVICLELQQPSQAVHYLKRATELDPARADFTVLYAKSLNMNRSPAEASAAADRAMELSPADPMALDTLGVIYAQTGAHERAVVAFRRAATLAPMQASCRFNLATSLITMGDLHIARSELEACIRLDHRHWPAYLALSQLGRLTQDANLVPRLLDLLDRHADDNAAKIHLNLALSREYENLGDYAKAFEHLTRGKFAARGHRPHAMLRNQILFDNLMRAFPLPQVAQAGDPSSQPIFVVGMPRSGTTLVERILSSHTDVFAAGELQNFAFVLQRESGSQTPFLFSPDLVERTHHIDWKKLGAAYLASTRPATDGKNRFIDKLPHNFLHVGFIAHALPNARIVCLRRDPMDTCLGNFRQMFDQTSCHFDYAFDLLDTGRYYILFDRLMTHWKQVFPGRIHEVHYESLVDSPEQEIRRLVDFCRLPWHDEYLHFEDNASPVATLSAVQVRSPLNRSSIGRWKQYGPQLAGLRALLADAGIPS